MFEKVEFVGGPADGQRVVLFEEELHRVVQTHLNNAILEHHYYRLLGQPRMFHEPYWRWLNDYSPDAAESP